MAQCVKERLREPHRKMASEQTKGRKMEAAGLLCPVELKLEVFVSQPVWLRQSRLHPCDGTPSALSHWATAPVPDSDTEKYPLFRLFLVLFLGLIILSICLKSVCFQVEWNRLLCSKGSHFTCLTLCFSHTFSLTSLSRHQRLPFLPSLGCYTNKTWKHGQGPLDRTTGGGSPDWHRSIPAQHQRPVTTCFFSWQLGLLLLKGTMSTDDWNGSGSFESRDLDSRPWLSWLEVSNARSILGLEFLILFLVIFLLHLYSCL